MVTPDLRVAYKKVGFEAYTQRELGSLRALERDAKDAIGRKTFGRQKVGAGEDFHCGIIFSH